jgi:hypothetical protein
VTTDGVSAAIDASGEVVAATNVGERRVLVGSITPREPMPTVLVRWGDWVGPVALAMLVALALAGWWPRAWRAAPTNDAASDSRAMPAPAIAVALPPGWRAAELALRVVSWGVLAWIGVGLLWPDLAPLGTLPRLRAFVAGVLAPTLAAWAIRRAFGAQPRLGPRRGLDHPLVKFALFPLLPAIPAFRLHQHIAFGGTFGEYYTYGLKAYLLAFGLWWAAWAIGLTVFAAALRAALEATVLALQAARPTNATAIRAWAERFARLAYYAGLPAYLLLRTLTS